MVTAETGLLPRCLQGRGIWERSVLIVVGDTGHWLIILFIPVQAVEKSRRLSPPSLLFTVFLPLTSGYFVSSARSDVVRPYSSRLTRFPRHDGETPKPPVTRRPLPYTHLYPQAPSARQLLPLFHPKNVVRGKRKQSPVLKKPAHHPRTTRINHHALQTPYHLLPTMN